MGLSHVVPENTGPQEEDEGVIVVVGESLSLSVLLRLRPSARLVVFRGLQQALDYLRHNRVAQVFIDPSAFSAACGAN